MKALQILGNKSQLALSSVLYSQNGGKNSDKIYTALGLTPRNS
jgi:hypothetical protein